MDKEKIKKIMHRGIIDPNTGQARLQWYIEIDGVNVKDLSDSDIENINKQIQEYAKLHVEELLAKENGSGKTLGLLLLDSVEIDLTGILENEKETTTDNR